MIEEDVTALIPKRVRLKRGRHDTYGDGMCAMEFADYLDRRRSGKRVRKTDGLTDHPACVCPTIGAFMRSWNDSLSDEDRNRLLLPLVPLCLDTAGGDALRERRSWMALDWLCRVHAPAWLAKAGLAEHAHALRELDPIVDSDSATRGQATLAAARDAARDAAWAAAGAAAWDAARDAAKAAARDAAGDAAWAAAWAAAGAAAWAAAGAAAAKEALHETVIELQESAADLVRRMCAEAVCGVEQARLGER